jgi:hypothetical protein
MAIRRYEKTERRSEQRESVIPSEVRLWLCVIAVIAALMLIPAALGQGLDGRIIYVAALIFCVVMVPKAILWGDELDRHVREWEERESGE